MPSVLRIIFYVFLVFYYDVNFLAYNSRIIFHVFQCEADPPGGGVPAPERGEVAD